MTTNALLFAHVITDLHNGAGQGLSHIDRPIIRERKTEFPYVQAETLKGNFRAEFRLRLPQSVTSDQLDILCGTEGRPRSTEAAADGKVAVVGHETGHRGFLEFTDANLLAMPVRSLRGGFVWLTTPLLLSRLLRFWQLAEPDWDKVRPVLGRDLPDGTILTAPGSGSALGVDGHAFLEEFAYSVVDSSEVGDLAAALAAVLWPDDPWWQARFVSHFGVVHADAFVHCVRHATEVKANIRIESEGERAGTTSDGSLRYTEYLPQESLLFALVEVEPVPDELLPKLRDATPQALFQKLVATKPLFQIGADETKGKGLVKFKVHPVLPAPRAT